MEGSVITMSMNEQKRAFSLLTFICILAFNHLYVYVCSVAQSCLTLCNPEHCSLPGSSVHGTFQARILEWVAISFSRGSS